MNRKIKYKVWDIYGKAFVDYYSISDNFVHVAIGDQYYLTNNLDADEEHKKYLTEKNIEIRDEYILCQFINSNDKEGKEVYENDVLEAPSGELFVVKWHDEELRWAMISKNTWYNMNMGILKVVGNVLETPSLIK